ncbi:Acb2/Tad1 domain-containing protein [Dyadobacter fermentans]
MSELRSTTESAEVRRLASVAITELQTAQMWAVKALTWRD